MKIRYLKSTKRFELVIEQKVYLLTTKQAKKQGLDCLVNLNTIKKTPGFVEI